MHPKDVELHAELDIMYDAYPDSAAIEQLLRHGARAHSRDAKGRPAIWKALDRDRNDVVELLLKYGANPDAADASHAQNRGTPLCYLIGLGRHNGITERGFDLMKTLLRAGASPTKTCPHGEAALAYALSINNGRSLRVLADAGIRVTGKPNVLAASHALAMSARSGNDYTVTVLIALGTDVNRKPLKHPLPLEIAVNHRHASTALLLLQAGAKPPRQDIVVRAIDRTKGHVPLIAALLAAGANPNVPDPHGRTALYYSLHREYVETMQILLAAGADPNHLGQRQPHPLHFVFYLPMNSRIQVAKALIEAGADLEARDRYDRTVLMRAAYAKDYAYTKLALESGANLHATNRRGEMAADLAVSHGAAPRLLDLLGQTPAEKRLIFGERLYNVARYHRIEDLRELIEAGVDLNARGKEGQTALEAAGRRKRGDMFQALLAAGANPNVVVLDGSPLQSANAASATVTITRRRQLGADDDPSVPLLTSAVMAANIDMVARLLQAGADPNALSASGDTALHLASVALAGNVEQAAGLLLKAGADPTLPNRAGFTPLTMAAKRRDIEVMRVLLDHGADVNATDRAGRTALNQTLAHGATHEYVQELINRGARPSDNDLAKARQIGSRALLELLTNAVAR